MQTWKRQKLCAVIKELISLMWHPLNVGVDNLFILGMRICWVLSFALFLSEGKKAVKGKEKSKSREEKLKPSDDELRAAICDILKEVDFNTVIMWCSYGFCMSVGFTLHLIFWQMGNASLFVTLRHSLAAVNLKFC